MANTDQAPAPYSAAPDPNTTPPDQGPSAAPAGMAPFIPTSPGRQRYVNHSQNRPLDQLGKRDWVLEGQYRTPGVSPAPAPQPWDVNNLKFQISHQLSGSGQGGPQGMGRIAQLAAQWGNHSGAFLKGAMQGQEYMMRLAKEKADFAESEMVRHSLRVIEDARYAIDFHGDSPNVFNELLQIARKNDDPRLEEAAKTGKVENVKKYLQWMDNNVLPVMQIQKQRLDYNAEKERIEDAKTKRERQQQSDKRRDDIFKSLTTPGAALPSPDTAAPASETEPAVPAPAAGGDESGRAGGLGGAAQGVGAPAAADSPDAGVDNGPAWMSGDAGPAPGAAPQQTADAGPDAAAPEVSAAPLGPDDDTAPADPNAPRRIPTAPGSPGQPGSQTLAPASAPGGGGRPPAAAPAAPAAAGTPPRAMTQIDRFAEDRLLGGKGAPSYHDKDIDSFVAGATAQKETQLRNDLDAIGRDPHILSMSDPQARRAAVLARVRQVSSRIGDRVDGLLSGTTMVNARAAEKWEIPISLAHLADPTFNTLNPQSRALTVRQFTYGQMGRQMLSNTVVFDHIDRLREAALALRPYQGTMFGNRQEMNQFYQYWTQHWGNANDPKVRAAMIAIGNYNALVHNVAPELERAITGSTPTVSGRQAQEAEWDASVPVDVLLGKIDSTRNLVIARTKGALAQFKAATGNSPAVDLTRLWTKFDQSGSINAGAFTGDKTGAEYDTRFPAVGPGVSSTMQNMQGMGPPQAAVDLLIAHPEYAAQFDRTFGGQGWKARDFLGAQ